MIVDSERTAVFDSMDKIPTVPNATMLQAFEWYTPAGGTHLNNLASLLNDLHEMGISALWLPPCCKASSPEGNGYDVYDLWDIGEFDQKGSSKTKWGSKQDLLALSKSAEEKSVFLYFDAVLNHKAAADKLERCRVQEVDSSDRTRASSEPYEINGWLGFDFPGRGEKHSKMKYHWYHFTGTDYNEDNQKTAIYQILGDGKSWSSSVDKEKGNFDYLMFADLDHAHPEVKQDIIAWGRWITKELGLSGFRFDAIKHFSEDFLREFIDAIQCEDSSKDKNSKQLFCVGEFWKDSLSDMCNYLKRMDRKFSLFDAPLVYNFSIASKTEKADLRSIFDDTLVKCEPVNAVTLVMNHDTQPGQALEAPIEGFFKPIAYALILLRAEGYPCVFWGDLYGTSGPTGAEQEPCAGGQLGDLIFARKNYAYGQQDDYFDQPNCIGWTRRGTWDYPDGCAVVLSNAGEGSKRMYVGDLHATEVWTDVLNWRQDEVTIGDDGFGDFKSHPVSVSVYVNKKAKGRSEFGKYTAKVD